MAIADKLTKLQTDISNAYSTIGMKGGTIPSNKNTDNLSIAINSIPSGSTPEPIEKDVNFYDYDGTRLYSYNKNDFLQLQEMPTNPAHDDLISQGWNYSLENAKTYINDYDKLDIGQMYDTNEHGLNIIIYINKYVLNTFQVILSNSTDTGIINWGDGTTSNISAGSDITYTHNYLQEGLYKIKVIPNGTVTIANGFVDYEHRVRVKGIEVGNNITLNGEKVFSDFDILETITLPYKQNIITDTNKYLFQYCRILNTVIIPKGIVATAEYMFSDCGSLEHIIFSDTFNVQSSSRIARYCFQNCSNIKNITFPNGIYSFNEYGLRYCYNFTKVVIPKTVTAIMGNAFDGMRYMKVFDFTHHTSVPTLRYVSAFGYIYSYKIVVPDSLYSTWIATSPWNNSSIVNNIVRKSDFDL